VKGFKDGVKGGEEERQANVPPAPTQQVADKSTTTIDVETREKNRS
jgi:sec-independent protein translocase protein TatA